MEVLQKASSFITHFAGAVLFVFALEGGFTVNHKMCYEHL